MELFYCRSGKPDAEQSVPGAVPAPGRHQQRKHTRGLCRGERVGRDPADDNRAGRPERKSARIERGAERHAAAATAGARPAAASALDQNESGQSGAGRLAHGKQQQRLTEGVVGNKKGEEAARSLLRASFTSYFEKLF